MAEQIPDARRSTDAAMALAHAATATHAIAEIQAAEDRLTEAIAAIQRTAEGSIRGELDSYHYSIRVALNRYVSTMATIGVTEDDDDED